MNWLTTFVPDWDQALAFLLDSAVKGSVVILIAAVAAWALRRHTAAARHSVWSAAIAAQLVIPVLSAVLPTWRVPVIAQPAWVAPASPERSPTPNEPTVTTSSSPVVTEPAPPANQTAPVSQNQATEATRSSLSLVLIVGLLWLLGCVAVLIRLAAGTAVVSRMAIRGERVTDEKWLGLLHRLAVTLNISRPLTLLRGDTLGVPVTWGIVYPVVLLPEDADAWPEERRRYVLVHEMAHVKRLDAFTQLVAQFALAIFWFNPLVWVAAQQMRRERENACDDYVISHGTKPSEYANDLLQLVQVIDTEGHRAAAPAFAALAMARRSEFEGRMLSILNPRIRRQGLTRKGVVMGLISTLLIAAPLAAFSPFSNERVQSSPQATAVMPEPVTRTDSNMAATPSTVSSAAQAPKFSQRTESNGSPQPCDNRGTFNGTGTTIHHSDYGRPDDWVLRFVQRSGSRCVEAHLNGNITFTRDEREIENIGPGGRVRFREVSAGVDREVTITSNGDRQRRDYLVNGRPADFDQAGRSWLGAVILTVIRESAFNAPERVRRLDQQGGTNLVLSEIDAIHSSGAKRSYYEALLEQGGNLSDSALTHIISRIRRDFRSSSGDLSSVLQKVPARSMRTTQSRSAFTDAMISIDSDGDKASLLIELVPTADRELLIEIMDVAKTIGSDGDKAGLLISAATSYLNPRDSELRDSYFGVAKTISAGGDLSRVLVNAARYGHGDERVTEAVLQTVVQLDSDGNKATVLIYVATQKLLTTSRIKSAYSTAAYSVESDGDRTRVLRAALINQ